MGLLVANAVDASNKVRSWRFGPRQERVGKRDGGEARGLPSRNKLASGSTATKEPPKRSIHP